MAKIQKIQLILSDTTSVYHINDEKIYKFYDSLSTNISLLTNHIIKNPDDIIKQSDSTFQWMPLVSVIIGGLITLGAQYFFKKWEIRKEEKKNYLNALISINQSFSMVLFDLKDLAYYKINSQYQLIQHKLADRESSQVERAKFLDEHYKAIQSVWECEKSVY